jgi:hypothetical protein
VALAATAALRPARARGSRRAGRVRTVAGTGAAGYEPEGPAGLPAAETPVDNPYGVVVGPDGALYFCEVDTGRTRRLDLGSGRLTTVAGNGVKAYAGDGGPALAATFNGPKGIAYSATDRSLYIVDTENHVIRRMRLEGGTIETVLGTGQRGDGPDGDPLACSMNRPHGVFVHRGVVYVTDSESHRVRALEGLS